MTQLTIPTYDALQAELEAALAEISASEIHGLMIGVLCGDVDGSAFHRVLVESGVPDSAHTALDGLYTASEKQLQDFLFEFNLILPDDDEPLSLRAENLTTWCQGFLTGLKLANVPLQDEKEADVNESIHDLIEIAQMNYEQVVASEEDEVAYAELVEYVRMAVITVYQGLRASP